MRKAGPAETNCRPAARTDSLAPRGAARVPDREGHADCLMNNIAGLHGEPASSRIVSH
jgi:hypothetical protein